MGIRRSTILGVSVLCALLLAVAAQAASTERTSSAGTGKRAPIQVGPGDGGSPSAVVDAAGTAHIVWGIAEELIGYCALPRGARGCSRTAQLALDARASRPFIVRRPQDGALIVVAGRDDIDSDPDESTWAFTSPDGVAWSAPFPIGVGIGAALDAVVLTADGGSVDLLQAGRGSNLYQRAPLGGPPSAAVLDLASRPAGTSTDYTSPGDLVRLRSGRTLALLGSPGDGFAYRILTGADPFADASWQPWPARVVTREWEEPRGAAGPRGAYVMYGVHILDQVRGAPPQVVRKLGRTRWGRPRGLFYEVDANTDRAALAQDGRGRLHAAIVGSANRGRRACIAYARTSKRRWFTRAVSLHQTVEDAAEPRGVQLAVDHAGRGVVAWATSGTPSFARVKRLKPGRGVTRPRRSSSRGCPPFPR